jgi:hypothetical protein
MFGTDFWTGLVILFFFALVVVGFSVVIYAAWPRRKK